MSSQMSFPYAKPSQTSAEESTGFANHQYLSGSDLLLLDSSNLHPRVQTLRARFSTVHDGVTPVQLERVVQRLQPLLRVFIPAVCNPPAKLQMQKNKIR